MMNDFDFLIPQEYRGQRIVVDKKLVLNIPSLAYYLDVNPLEDEEEFNGFQDASDRQQIIYHAEDGSVISCEDAERKITTANLMSGLERILKRVY